MPSSAPAPPSSGTIVTGTAGHGYQIGGRAERML